jgi:hypothetical protein
MDSNLNLVAIVLITIGAAGTVIGFIKERQQLEWEHWAEKLIWRFVLAISIISMIIGIGTSIVFII